MGKIYYKPIGIIHTPIKVPNGAPIQPSAGTKIKGSVEIFPEYIKGLKDLLGFSHIILIYHFHQNKTYSLLVKPFLDNQLRGVFSTRAPSRPNSIGLSIVRLQRIKDNILYIQDLDIIDGTPLLDIKPFIDYFDNRKTNQIGWIKDRISNFSKTKSDKRFC